MYRAYSSVFCKYVCEIICLTDLFNFKTISDPQTPVAKCLPNDAFMQTSGKFDDPSLVGIDDDDVPVEVYKGLKLGFTPGTDKKSRRVCFRHFILH